eukprot:COSAG06_NODE_6302_length_2991_cov_4.691586_3_plen_102_part_00
MAAGCPCTGDQMKKKIAVHAEDYDLAKQFKSQIQKLEKSLEPPPPPSRPMFSPPPPPPPLSELSAEERHAKRVRDTGAAPSTVALASILTPEGLPHECAMR